MIEEDGRVPVLDVGTVAKIREGKIKVRGAIESFVLRHGTYSPKARRRRSTRSSSPPASGPSACLLAGCEGAPDTEGSPPVSDKPTAEPGLHPVGAIVTPTGQFRQIGIAQRASRIEQALHARDQRRRVSHDENSASASPWTTCHCEFRTGLRPVPLGETGHRFHTVRPPFAG